MTDPADDELLALNQRLLDSIASGDWPAYEQLCDPTLTAFEPEARGHLVAGMEFHRFYLDRPRSTTPSNTTPSNTTPSNTTPSNTTMSCPHVRMMGDVAVVSCVRLTQYVDAEGKEQTAACEETRVWRRQDGAWRHVHFHRSANT